MPAGRRPVEESVATDTVDPRAEGLNALLQGSLEDQGAVAEMLAAPAPVVDASKPVKWDGDGKYLVVASAVMTALIDNDYKTAGEGTVLGLSKSLGDRGVELGVLQKL